MFDCVQFDELRMKLPSFYKILQSIRNGRGFAEESDLGFLLNAIQKDCRLGFSLASFVHQAISLRTSWLGEVCVRGRLCTPPGHWPRDLFQDPPSAYEFPPDFEQTFTEGRPWFFDEYTIDI